MKRKEMISCIKNILDNLEDYCSNSLIAQTILNEIEVLGMLPPPIVKRNNEKTEIVREWEEA